MQAGDRIFLAGLIAAGGWIWLREASALQPLADTIPLLAALPLLVWLAAPWHLQRGGPKFQPAALAVAGVALVAGLASGFVVLLTLAWTALLWSWLRPRLAAADRPRIWRLLPLALLAFPWLSLDLPALGWWYRLSAAWSVEHVLQILDLAVRREGSQLFVQQMPFDVTPACSGIQTLQAMLVAGAALCFLQVGGRRCYWLTLLLLPLVAWLANSLRVLLLIVAALSFGPEAVSGWLHSATGWVVLMVMFGLTWLGLEMLRAAPQARAAA